MTTKLVITERKHIKTLNDCERGDFIAIKNSSKNDSLEIFMYCGYSLPGVHNLICLKGDAAGTFITVGNDAEIQFVDEATFILSQ